MQGWQIALMNFESHVDAAVYFLMLRWLPLVFNNACLMLRPVVAHHLPRFPFDLLGKLR